MTSIMALDGFHNGDSCGRGEASGSACGAREAKKCFSLLDPFLPMVDRVARSPCQSPLQHKKRKAVEPA
jgi:hypothetical protein